MQWWANIWLAVLVIGFLLFASVSLAVSVLGFRDMQLMFRSIMRKHDSDDLVSSPNESTD